MFHILAKHVDLSPAGHAAAALPWHHALATGYAPAWLAENADGIRGDWPRVPLPGSAGLLRASAGLGARVAALLDPDAAVPGVTTGALHSALATSAMPAPPSTSRCARLPEPCLLSNAWQAAGDCHRDVTEP